MDDWNGPDLGPLTTGVDHSAARDLFQRRRRRHRQRRRVAVGAIAALVMFGAVAVVAATGNDDGIQVASGPPERATSTVEPGGAPLSSVGLRAEPADGLSSGDEVTVSVDDPAEADDVAWIGQCVAEVVDDAFLEGASDAELRRSCRNVRDDPGVSTTLTVDREVPTPTGINVACDGSPGRCIAVARLRGDDGLRWAELGFLAAGPPAPPLSVSVSASAPVPDGTTITASGTGGPPGAAIRLVQCRASGATEPMSGFEGCDVLRSKELLAGDDGTFETPFVVSAQLTVAARAGSGQPTIVRCEPCELRVQSLSESRTASTSIEVTSGTEDIVPSVRIVEPGPHQPGQRVTLEGTGFQIGGRPPTLGWCSDVGQTGRPDDCAYPEAAFEAVDIDGSGTFRIPDFPLPPADFTTSAGVRCTDAAGTCMLATVPGEGQAYLFKVPLDLSG